MSIGKDTDKSSDTCSDGVKLSLALVLFAAVGLLFGKAGGDFSAAGCASLLDELVAGATAGSTAAAGNAANRLISDNSKVTLKRLFMAGSRIVVIRIIHLLP